MDEAVEECTAGVLRSLVKEDMLPAFVALMATSAEQARRVSPKHTKGTTTVKPWGSTAQGHLLLNSGG